MFKLIMLSSATSTLPVMEAFVANFILKGQTSLRGKLKSWWNLFKILISDSPIRESSTIVYASKKSGVDGERIPEEPRPTGCP